MKRLAIALILTCLVSFSALAGDIPTSGAPSPQSGNIPTAGATQSGSSTQPGDVPTVGATQSGGSTQTSSVAAAVLLTIIGLIGR